MHSPSLGSDGRTEMEEKRTPRRREKVEIKDPGEGIKMERMVDQETQLR